MPIYRAQSFTTLRRGRKSKLDTSEYCLSMETKLAEAEIRHKSLLAALQHRNEEVKRLRMLIDRLTKDVHHRRVEALSMCWCGSTPETPTRAMRLENGAPPRAYRDGGEKGSFPPMWSIVRLDNVAPWTCLTGSQQNYAVDSGLDAPHQRAQDVHNKAIICQSSSARSQQVHQDQYGNKQREAGRAIDFDELYCHGRAETKHMIVCYPPGTDNWYILLCHEHMHFGVNALQGAAKHLCGPQHGIQPRSYELAIFHLGIMVLNCDVEKAEKNNNSFREALGSGYRPYNVRNIRAHKSPHRIGPKRGSPRPSRPNIFRACEPAPNNYSGDSTRDGTQSAASRDKHIKIEADWSIPAGGGAFCSIRQHRETLPSIKQLGLDT